MLTDRPEQAKFLTKRGEGLANGQARRANARPRKRCATYSMFEAMIDPKVLLLALNYFGIVTASLGMLFFIPQIIKSLGTFEQHDGRLADHDPLHLRRHRPGRRGAVSPIA